MSCYQNFNLFSQFSYGIQHFQEASRTESKMTAFKEITLGIIEFTPIFGLFAAYIEKITKNNTFEKRMVQRELFVNEQISSGSFGLQSLYFDTQSSARLYCDESSPKEYNAFIKDYKEFDKLRDSYPIFKY